MDTTIMNKKYPEPSVYPMIKDNFTFYYIGGYSNRKNVLGIVAAFQTEFNSSEPVSLVINLTENPTQELQEP
jgi:hypothetical protein